jgi:hypothetical protein
VLPDELEHEQLVKVGVEQGARNGIQLPVMVVRAPGEFDDHPVLTLLEGMAGKEARCTVEMARRPASPGISTMG